jgi:hypothetical protein
LHELFWFANIACIEPIAAEVKMSTMDISDANEMKMPYLKKSRFTEMLIAENELDQGGFDSWIFCQGMLFNSHDKWWGDHGLRDFPHEGIDLCLFKDGNSRICQLAETTRIPVMADGVVKAMFKDYLGIAIVIEHEPAGTNCGNLLSIYAHTQPRPGIDIGVSVHKGDIIATLADTSHSKANIRPHLHFSLGLCTAPISYDGFVWNTIRKPEMITLMDPLAVIDGPYQVLDAGDPGCRGL